MAQSGRAGGPAPSIRVVKFPNFDSAFVEAVHQARVDAHLAEVAPKRLPVRTASADRAMVDECGGDPENGVDQGGSTQSLLMHTYPKSDYHATSFSNAACALKRAASVAATLVKDYGVPAGQMTLVGAGLAAPIATNDNDTGQAKNRRVELVKM